VPWLASPAGVALQHELAVVELANREPGFLLWSRLSWRWLARIRSERYAAKNVRQMVGLSRASLEDCWIGANSVRDFCHCSSIGQSAKWYRQQPRAIAGQDGRMLDGSSWSFRVRIG